MYDRYDRYDQRTSAAGRGESRKRIGDDSRLLGRHADTSLSRSATLATGRTGNPHLFLSAHYDFLISMFFRRPTSSRRERLNLDSKSDTSSFLAIRMYLMYHACWVVLSASRSGIREISTDAELVRDIEHCTNQIKNEIYIVCQYTCKSGNHESGNSTFTHFYHFLKVDRVLIFVQLSRRFLLWQESLA